MTNNQLDSGNSPIMTTASPSPYIVSPKTYYAKSRHPNYSSLDQTIQSQPQSRTATPSRSSSPVPPVEELVYDCFLHSIGKLQDPNRIKMTQAFTDYVSKTHITENLDFLVNLLKYQHWLEQIHEASQLYYHKLVNSLSDLNISHQISQEIIASEDKSPMVFAKARKQVMQLLMENCTEFGSYVRKQLREELRTPQDSPNLSPISPPFSPTFSPTELRNNPVVPSNIPRSKPRNITTVSNGTKSALNSNQTSAEVSSNSSSVSSTTSFLGQLKIGKEATATTSSSSSLKFWSRKK